MFVEAVDVVHFLQVELEFVIISDGDIKSNERTLVVVKALSTGCQVFVGMVLFCVVCCF